MMEWTRERPTEPGWYLRWIDGDEEPMFIKATLHRDKLQSQWGTPIELYRADCWWMKIEKPEGQNEAK